ncbi:DHHA1 domain-containing protein [Neobacillus niacini]|uniref:alanyl-tRNA editing protein n=1 Tax=Neobacillus niacini TaxID=86668 RepID=UPI00286713B4|nr:DHHA1 domain-containing protein [Neobacillus niacini]MDR7000546.1 alanyl-tRNA synthetase [Neobacillus niacini]
MRNKLYYQDPYIQAFSSAILKQERDVAGNWYVVLEETAFYPTGGGQPHDIGTVGGKAVINVEEIEGEVRHYLEEPLKESDGKFQGVIDWSRRFDHMQQHAGQHILSAAFDQLFHYQTVGFHLGKETLTIDIETETLTGDEVEKTEKLANQIILENRSIEVKWVTEDELSSYRLRKATKVKEDIRLVIIPEFDYNACGGTHPKATGEVQAIKILDWERQKKKIRVQFVCGNRVLQQLHEKNKILMDLTRLLNAPEKEMGQAVIRLLETGKGLEKSLEQAHDQLLHYEARELLAKYKNQTIGEVYQNRTIQELQKLARLITTENGDSLVYLLSENENRLQMVCARGTARTENMKTIIGKGISLINGKGGGSDSFAQGGGEMKISGEQMLQYLANS